MEDLRAKLSTTQLQLGAVQRNYDAMSGAHLLTCISCACPANIVAHELHAHPAGILMNKQHEVQQVRFCCSLAD